jgi:phospholipid/cholesterol/gamma-HCH transport system permease protein
MSMKWVAAIGQIVVDQVSHFSRFIYFCIDVVAWFIRGPRGGGRLGLLLPRLYLIGTKSVPIVMVAGSFVGAVVAIEMYDQFQAFGLESRVGGAIHLAVFKQIGPVLAGAMIGGRIGGAIAAEIGSMRTNDQVDALRVMGINPISHLAVPRVVACILMLPVLTVVADMLGVVGGYLVAVRGFGVEATAYWSHSAATITNWDLLGGLAKSVVFGAVIGLVSCYKGFHCRATADQVGRATTEAFVVSFITIIIANLIMAYLINELYTLIYGTGRPTVIGG